MSDRSTKRKSGFSLLEMTISLALGGLVLAAAVQIYIQGVQAAWITTQRAELQQDFRAASNILTTNLSLAGAGLNPGAAIALPSTTTPVYGCDQSLACYINGGSVTYPIKSGKPYLYGLLPGYQKGPTLFALQGPTDVVTVAYTDNSFYLNCYAATVTSLGVVTFAPPVTNPVTPWPTPGCLPANPPSTLTAPQAVNDSSVGLTAGDLVLMSLNGTQVVGEVTGPPTATVGVANSYAVPFANLDVLHMNQTPSGGGLNSAPLHATGAAGPLGACPCRLLVVSYYIDNSPTPPRLMQQVSGHTPIPVAENVVFLQFTYDLFNDATNSTAVSQPNPGSGDANDQASNGLVPNQITKINIVNMAMDSTLPGVGYGGGNGGSYQRLDLQTSVSARNLTYTNNYPSNAAPQTLQ
jgi:prepilin-type N-terminal cleavage/methylation domain-containing protein